MSGKEGYKTGPIRFTRADKEEGEVGRVRDDVRRKETLFSRGVVGSAIDEGYTSLLKEEIEELKETVQSLEAAEERAKETVKKQTEKIVLLQEKEKSLLAQLEEVSSLPLKIDIQEVTKVGKKGKTHVLVTANTQEDQKDLKMRFPINQLEKVLNLLSQG